MSNVIYYFSATGNSLMFARSLAAGLGDTELISIPRSMGGSVCVSAGRVADPDHMSDEVIAALGRDCS